jgi:predicted CoA-substrate-specific enzyme activase
MQYYLGIDSGSICTKLALLNSQQHLVASVYLATGGEPVNSADTALKQLQAQLPADISFARTAITGSGRHLISRHIRADIVKNEITAQAAAGLHYFHDARTIIEIGGQDSKIILIRDGLITDFSMNTVCAAGTGSFLDHQAQRLGLSLTEFSKAAIRSKAPVSISGRCTVFAESDMIHQQQSGAQLEDIVYGLCKTLAVNFLTGVASGKDIYEPVIFQGGVVHNLGMVRAFEEALNLKLVIPPYPELTGAIGAALIAQTAE